MDNSGTVRSTQRKNRRSCALLAVIALLCAAMTASAQEPQFRQFEQNKLSPTTIIPPEEQMRVSPMPEDEDEIGRQFILKRRVGVPQFALTGDSQYYFTSNGLLTDSDHKGAPVFVGSAGASWNPTWIKDVTGSVYARQQFFRYDRLNDIDFDATSFGFNAGGPILDWFTLSGGYSVTRLVSRETDDEFYREGDLSLVVSRAQMFGMRMQVPYGYTIDFYHTSPGDFTRVTHGLFAGVNYLISPRWLAQFFYRFQMEDYQSSTRFDQAHILTAGVNYSITEWAIARAFISWTTNDSSIQRDYDVYNGGVGLNLQVKF